MLVDTIALALYKRGREWRERTGVAIHERFFMLRNFELRDREFLVPDKPYRLLEGRIVWVKKGSASYAFDLVDHVFSEGDIVVFMGGTLIEKRWHSADFAFDAVTFESDAVRRKGFVRRRLATWETDIIETHMKLIWLLVSSAEEHRFPKENIHDVTSSLLRQIAPDANNINNQQDQERGSLTDRFIHLVSLHGATERTVGFYANRLRLSQHYLCNKIRSDTGRSVMDWVGEVACKEIAVWLIYSDESIGGIADRLAYSSVATMCKFFRRKTGLSPTEYREANRLRTTTEVPADELATRCFKV